MAGALPDRDVVVRTLLRFVELTTELVRQRGHVVLSRDAPLDELLALACSETGLEIERYLSALEHHPDLAHLQKESLLRVVTEGQDPGPYDAISGRDPADSWKRAH